VAVVAFATLAQAQEFPCTVASITDGDTFSCTDGKKIRIHGIDAPEMDSENKLHSVRCRQTKASESRVYG
jgi:endonuclease YncB( thermonuclease family)